MLQFNTYKTISHDFLEILQSNTYKTISHDFIDSSVQYLQNHFPWLIEILQVLTKPFPMTYRDASV